MPPLVVLSTHLVRGHWQCRRKQCCQDSIQGAGLRILICVYTFAEQVLAPMQCFSGFLTVPPSHLVSILCSPLPAPHTHTYTPVLSVIGS